MAGNAAGVICWAFEMRLLSTCVVTGALHAYQLSLKRARPKRSLSVSRNDILVLGVDCCAL